MTGYCKHCEQAHSTWTRLNDGLICGHCGTRVRDLRVKSVNVQRTRLATKSRLSGRASF